jgi:hypothetical protein
MNGVFAIVFQQEILLFSKKERMVYNKRMRLD